MSTPAADPAAGAVKGAPAAPPDHVPLRTWIAVATALLGAFMAILDIQVTNASLLNILGTLSATQSEGSWISTSYLVAEIVVIPLSAWLAVVFSLRRYLIAHTALFLIFSTLCGLAWNLPSMIIFRAAQGFAGGVLIPMAMTIVTRLLPPRKRPIGFAMFGLTATLAPSLGPTLGGYLTELYGWPSVFFINWVPGVILIAGALYGLPREPMQLDRLHNGDWIGVGAMAMGLGSLTLCLEEGNSKDWFSSDYIRITAILAFVGIAGWVISGLAHRESFVNLRLLVRRNFLAATLTSFCVGFGLYGSSFILPLFLGQIAGYNSMQIGEVIMWMGLPQLLVMPFAVRLSLKLDNRLLLSFGLLLFAISCFMNSGMTADTARDQLLWAQVVRAFGQPFVMVPLGTLVMREIEPWNMGSASSLYNMMRNLGGSVGIAMLATLLSWREHFHSARIGEAVTLFDAATRSRLDQIAQNYLGKGFDATRAQEMAIGALDRIVRRESYVMAYNDMFLTMGLVLSGCVLVVWMADRVVSGQGPGGGGH